MFQLSNTVILSTVLLLLVLKGTNRYGLIAFFVLQSIILVTDIEASKSNLKLRKSILNKFK